MKVEVKENAKPVAAKAKRYPPEGRRFMRQYVSRILEYGFGEVTTKA